MIVPVTKFAARVANEMPVLTVHGREVSELLRPPKWTAENRTMTIGVDPRAIVRTWVRKPDRSHAFTVDSEIGEPNLGDEIVALLNARDLAEAKRYKARS